MISETLILEIYKRVTAPLDEESEMASHQADTLNCLCAEALLAYKNLLEVLVRGTDAVQYACFACRNIVELSIWVEYCSKSEKNAALFKQDVERDVNGMVQAFEHLARLDPALPKDFTLDVLTEHLKTMSVLAGIRIFDTQFKSVADAADELGAETGLAFRKVNKILSKFVHPTALSVKALLYPEEETKLGLINFRRAVFLDMLLDLAKLIPVLTGKAYPQDHFEGL